LEEDGTYRRAAVIVGVAGVVLSLIGWASILAFEHHPWWWLGPIALTAVWARALSRLRRW
jgi:hypothetical protein